MEEYNLGSEPQSKAKKIAVSVILAVVGLLLAGFAIYNLVTTDYGKTSKHLTYLNYDNFSKIENGMTYEEVVQIFEGHEGKLDTQSSVGDFSLAFYTWENELGTRYVSIGFENGKVYSKSQFGLR